MLPLESLAPNPPVNYLLTIDGNASCLALLRQIFLCLCGLSMLSNAHLVEKGEKRINGYRDP